MSVPNLITPSNCTCGQPWHGIIPPVCPVHRPLAWQNREEPVYTTTTTSGELIHEWTSEDDLKYPEFNVLDRTPKPSPRRHTGPLKDLLLGILIGAGLMLGCFALGALQVWLGL